MDILELIPTGKQNAISTDDLEAITGLDVRTLRRMVADARMRGAVICSSLKSEGGGYFQPACPAEAMGYVWTEQCRIESAREALKSAVRYVTQLEEAE